MAATFLPSNLIVPNEKLLMNPNWVQTESGTPVSSVLVEGIQDRLIVAIGRHPAAYIERNGDLVDQGLVDRAANEVSANFRMHGDALQLCTGFQVEEFTLTGPLSGSSGSPSSRNLTETLCGDYIDDSFAEPRRFAPMATDMTIPIIVAGELHTFNMANFLPHGQAVAYYTLSDVLSWFLDAWTNFMQNRIGDASFTTFVYVDAVSPRIFWYSTTYSMGDIRLQLSDVRFSGIPSFLSLIKNHLFIMDTRTGDTSQSGSGYAVGESMGILPRRQTGIQNNASCLTLHSPELCQFRKNDSLAPADGSTLIGVLSFPTPQPLDATSGVSILAGSTKAGGFTTPKVSFDKTQTLTEFSVYLRAVDAAGSTLVQFSQTELRQMTLLMIIRCW